MWTGTWMTKREPAIWKQFLIKGNHKPQNTSKLSWLEVSNEGGEKGRGQVIWRLVVFDWGGWWEYRAVSPREGSSPILTPERKSSLSALPVLWQVLLFSSYCLTVLEVLLWFLSSPSFTSGSLGTSAIAGNHWWQEEKENAPLFIWLLLSLLMVCQTSVSLW